MQTQVLLISGLTLLAPYSFSVGILLGQTRAGRDKQQDALTSREYSPRVDLQCVTLNST